MISKVWLAPSLESWLACINVWENWSTKSVEILYIDYLRRAALNISEHGQSTQVVHCKRTGSASFINEHLFRIHFVALKFVQLCIGKSSSLWEKWIIASILTPYWGRKSFKLVWMLGVISQQWHKTGGRRTAGILLPPPREPGSTLNHTFFISLCMKGLQVVTATWLLNKILNKLMLWKKTFESNFLIK